MKSLKAECFLCKTNDEAGVYLRCVYRGEELFVCVRCLPVLIHGGGHGEHGGR